jgi:protein-L-isoaspartate(D-aspartate) O-methyltransferase
MNTDFARSQMIEQQIRTNDVSNPLIVNALQRLSREKFVPAAFVDLAFADDEIPLPHGQCMLRPTTEGKILQALALEATDSVLEIGTGTGYFTACLAELAASVTSIDIYSDLIAVAEKNLADTGISNVELQCMDMQDGLPPGHFDAIIVSGSMRTTDERLIAALKPGGRLFAVTGNSPVKDAILVTRDAEQNLKTARLFETDLPALVNVAQEPAFFF